MLPELAGLVWQRENMWLALTQSMKKNEELTKEFQRGTCFSWFQPMYSIPVTGYTQHHDTERVTETGNRNHIGIVIELYIAIVVFC